MSGETPAVHLTRRYLWQGVIVADAGCATALQSHRAGARDGCGARGHPLVVSTGGDDTVRLRNRPSGRWSATHSPEAPEGVGDGGSARLARCIQLAGYNRTVRLWGRPLEPWLVDIDIDIGVNPHAVCPLTPDRLAAGTRECVCVLVVESLGSG
jgi:hypothetical protein